MIRYYVIIIYKCRPCPIFDELYPGICLTIEGKHGKTSVRVSQYTIRNHNHISQYKIIQSMSLSAKQHTLLFTVIIYYNWINASLYTVNKCRNKHKHNHTIKITARYIGFSVSRWNVEGKTFVGNVHSWSLTSLKLRYTIRIRIFKFCDKVTQYMLYTFQTRIFKL